MHRYVQCFFIFISLIIAQPALALQCSSPTLKSAAGVIGNKHLYKITGQCTYTWSETETGVGSSKTTTGSLSFSYVGSASWDRQTGESVEKLDFTGDAVGERAAVANCSQDPFLKDPPGGAASCGPVKVQVEIESGNIYKLLLKEVFWASKKLSLAEAQALSALPKPNQSPPPEKPKTKPLLSSSTLDNATVGGMVTTGVGGMAVASGDLRGTDAVSVGSPPQDAAGRAALIESMHRGGSEAAARQMPANNARASTATISSMSRAVTVPVNTHPTQMELEGEALVNTAKFQVNGGQVQVQQMGGFNGNWSGGAQLFWSGGQIGAVLDLIIDVPAASKYAVEIYMTRAPDFGKLSFEVDGQPSETSFDGMAPEVMTSGPIQLGTFSLLAGQRQVSMMIVGKYPQATDYHVGIDKLRLYPAGPIDESLQPLIQKQTKPNETLTNTLKRMTTIQRDTRSNQK